MRRPICRFALLCLVLAGASAFAAEGRVLKVLPQFLDLQGRHTRYPGLYDRDAYQAYLRLHTNEISGVRFAVQWKAHGPRFDPLKLRVELIGAASGDVPSKTLLEQEVKSRGWFSHWTTLALTGDEYRKLGSLTAWRATLWDGDRLLSEQKSFLW